MQKKTMTLNLTQAEMASLDELCRRKGVNKTALLRQALKLYQTIDQRLHGGEKLVFENQLTQAKTELVVL